MKLEARLRAFAAVVREGSFSRAASALYVSQPAVSKHLASLEAELGAKLVVRDKRGVELTPEGQLLADYVLRAEALLANAERALATAADVEAGLVTVAASGIPANYLLPLMQPASSTVTRASPSTCCRRPPGARSNSWAHTRPSSASSAALSSRRPRVGAAARGRDRRRGNAGVARRRLRPADLHRLTWVSREEGSGTRAAVEAARQQLGIDDVRTIEAATWEAVKTLVAGGAGIAAISRFAINHELTAGALAILDVPRWQLRRTLSLVYARDVPLTPAAARFRDALRAFAPPVQDGSVSDLGSADVEQLSVFVSGFEADAAEYVCNVDRTSLDQLVARGVLGREGSRYTVSERAVDAPAPTALARRHAEFFALLNDETAERLRTSGEAERAERLALEERDVEAAVHWAVASKEWELFLRIIGPSWRVWLRRGYPTNGATRSSERSPTSTNRTFGCSRSQHSRGSRTPLATMWPPQRTDANGSSWHGRSRPRARGGCVRYWPPSRSSSTTTKRLGDTARRRSRWTGGRTRRSISPRTS